MTGPRALVLRYHSLGDVVLVTGVVRALHRSGFLVDVVTEARFRSVFEGSPWVAGLFTREEWEPGATSSPSESAAAPHGASIETARVYDRVIDLQASPSSRRATRDLGPRVAVNTRSLARRWIVATGNRPPRPSVPHAVLRYAEAAFSPRFGGPPAPGLEELTPEVTVTATDRAALASQLPEFASPAPLASSASNGSPAPLASPAPSAARPRVALLTGASRLSKAYPRERFVSVGRAFEGRGWDVLWVEEPSESPPTAPVGTRVAVGLGALEAVLSTVQLAVSGDSGPMHLATALGVPVVAVFGSSVRTFGFTPLGPGTQVLEVPGLFCRPCGVHGRNRCWRGGFPCLDVSADLVVAAALALVGETHEGAGRSTALRVRGEEDGSSAARAQSGSVADPEGPTDPKGPATGPKGPAADPSGPGREPGSERRGERSGARAEARTSIRTKASASERTGTQAVEKKAEGTAKP